MPEYTFENNKGERRAFVYAMAEAPRIGDTVFRDGRVWRRVPDWVYRDARRDICFTSKQLPLHWPFAPRHNEKGEPQFASKREVTEALARAKDAGEPVDWD